MKTYFTGSSSSLVLDNNTSNISAKEIASNSGPVNSSREEIEQEIANVESQIDTAVNSEDFELAGILLYSQTNYKGFIYKEAHHQYQCNTGIGCYTFTSCSLAVHLMNLLMTLSYCALHNVT